MSRDSILQGAKKKGGKGDEAVEAGWAYIIRVHFPLATTKNSAPQTEPSYIDTEQIPRTAPGAPIGFKHMKKVPHGNPYRDEILI